jgi:hypothetical protein
MRPTPDDLKATVYRFYPRGLDDDHPGYKDTEEHRRLVQARIQAGAESHPWRELLSRLRERLPDAEYIHNGSLHLPTGHYDAGYIGWMSLPSRRPNEKNHSIGFLISFLVSYYVVYSTVLIANPTTTLNDWSQEIRFDFSPDEAPAAQVITREIESIFPGYEFMPPEIGNIVVPDVVAGNKFMGKTTLYHCLFTDTW